MDIPVPLFLYKFEVFPAGAHVVGNSLIRNKRPQLLESWTAVEHFKRLILLAMAFTMSKSSTTPTSFWDPRGYMSIVQRTAHGYDLCDQLGESIGDLGSVIQSFAKGLSGWSQTWRAKIGTINLTRSDLGEIRRLKL